MNPNQNNFPEGIRFNERISPHGYEVLKIISKEPCPIRALDYPERRLASILCLFGLVSLGVNKIFFMTERGKAFLAGIIGVPASIKVTPNLQAVTQESVELVWAKEFQDFDGMEGR
jgi:hypothetical protein